MTGRVDRASDGRQAAGGAGGRFVVHDQHGADGVIVVGAEYAFNQFRIDALAPVGIDDIHLEAQAPGDTGPQARELSGFEGQDAIAR